ncbi:2,4-dienoyl-CoA reductase [Escherichia coli]|uniref:2,4-dienoyl-CoA reductase n=1 Tax=Escherichia coli TaxID=562 RepID=A0A2X3K331_ECOLX|nr:2,4-dienoyl-CoA reductase [Escherichia coli]
MGSMHTGLEEYPDGAERLATFYAERARHGVALIVSGGIAPDLTGVGMEGGAMLNDASQIPHHRTITEAVHQEGGKIALQILHTGRYSYQPHLVAPSALQAPINRFVPHELTHEEILQLIDDFAHCAQLAREAGYDGVEVMGSEGYLINEFLTLRTNQRSDQWGRRLPQPDAICRRSSACGARTRRQRLHYYLPTVDARPGRRRRDFCRNGRAGAGH